MRRPFLMTTLVLFVAVLMTAIVLFVAGYQPSTRDRPHTGDGPTDGETADAPQRTRPEKETSETTQAERDAARRDEP